MGNNKKIYLVDHFTITAAFRYALGRKSAIVKHIVDMIIDNWHLHSEEDKKGMVKEIFQYKNDYGKIGHSIDEDEWMRIVEKQLEDYKKSIRYE
jgi:hypothetical protein